MKLTARVALLVLAFISLTGIIGGGIFVHQHSGQGSGGQTLTGTTINNPIITGATLTGTINNPTITGTITGTPIWSSTQSLNTSGNAATVTTNANLTGPITSSGNVTSIASGNTYPSPTFTGTVSGTPIWASGQTFPNVTASTSVVTPLVGTTTAAVVGFQYNGTTQLQFDNVNLVPVADNSYNFGGSANRIAKVFTPIIDSGTTGSLLLRTNNGTTVARFDNIASAVNFLTVVPSATTVGIQTYSNGTDANVDWNFGVRGSGAYGFFTDYLNTQVKQFSILHTASASRNITVTGSNGGDPTISTTAGSLNVGTTLTSTKACATNYTRVGPNFCRATVFATDAWADATACTGRTFAKTLPADAKALVLNIEWAALANNAVAARLNTIAFFSDTSCTNQVWFSSHRSQEFVATVAGTILTIAHEVIIVPPSTTNQINTTQTNAGGNGNADVQSVYLMGYFD